MFWNKKKQQQQQEDLGTLWGWPIVARKMITRVRPTYKVNYRFVVVEVGKFYVAAIKADWRTEARWTPNDLLDEYTTKEDALKAIEDWGK